MWLLVSFAIAEIELNDKDRRTVCSRTCIKVCEEQHRVCVDTLGLALYPQIQCVN